MQGLQILAALAFFAILLGLSGWFFGEKMGGFARGAALPMFTIPLLTDWTRYFGVGFSAAVGSSLVVYACVTAGVLILGRSRGGGSGAGSRVSREWILAFVILFAAHALVRTWIFTGSVPIPADDTFGGYKASGLLHAAGWPAMHPEAPELPFSYYYYSFVWPATLSALLHVPLTVGWWATAVTLCVTGGMLIFEVIAPYLRSTGVAVLAALALFNGASIAFVLALSQGFAPRHWGHFVQLAGDPFSLYIRVPQGFGGYITPFAIFSTGALLVIVVLSVEWMSRRWTIPEVVFSLLGLSSLVGYCTFHIIGTVLAVLPPLLVAAAVTQRQRVFLNWLPRLAAIGFGAMLLSAPLLLLYLERKSVDRAGRFQNPLLVWLGGAFEKFPADQVLWLLFWIMLVTLASNVVALACIPQWRKVRSHPLALVLFSMFALGTIVCLCGVTDDFVAKFGNFAATAAVVVFFMLPNKPKWCWVILLISLIGPILDGINAARANIVKPKMDEVWKTIDRETAKSGEVVLYDVDEGVKRSRLPWDNIPPFFSRARFVVPATQIEGILFVSDPGEFQNLPPTPVRLANFAGGHSTYLLLTDPSHEQPGTELYRSTLFTLRRVPFPEQ